MPMVCLVCIGYLAMAAFDGDVQGNDRREAAVTNSMERSSF